MSTGGRVVGTSVRRVDVDKVTGAARFAGDLREPGMLYGQVLRSPHASARIVRVDPTPALAVPGVRAVLTGADLDPQTALYGHAIKDRPIVAIDRVRFAGEPVAAVAADSPQAAAEAAERIEVVYEPLPGVTTLAAALAPGAPRVHEATYQRGLFHGLGEFADEGGNVCYHYRVARGEGRAAFEAPGLVVVENEYTFPAVYQYAMEPHTVIARWGSDGLTVHACCQHPYLVRAELADLFGLPLAAVRVIVPYIGGGFGSKSYTKMEPITAALARKAGAPVRIANRVDEAMVTTRRHNMRCWMRSAATRDGRVVARECRAWLDTGAYADNGPRVAATAGDAAPGPYRWDAVAVDAWAIYTNTPPAGSYRGFGATHLQWIGEAQIDALARAVGMDRLEFRRRNLLRPGEEVRPGGKPLDADLVGDVERAAAAIGWGTPAGPEVGRGLSVGLLAAGANPVSVAAVRLQADGTAVVLASTSELGQGARTVFAQIVGEELALPVERVRVMGADTQFTPYDRSTGASRSTTLAGTAVLRAAVHLREQLLDIAASRWGLPASALRVRDGAVWHETERLTYPDLLREHFGMPGGELIGRGEVRPQRGTGSFAEGPVFWEVCVGGAEVEVDRETGRVRVRRLASVADVGKAINPQLVEAQDEGGSLQGVGNALYEEMVFEDGQLLNGSLVDYHVPTIADVPDEMVSVLVENADGPGPYGAKGVGEGSLAFVPGAIVGALAELGIEVTGLPLTPERVWRRLRGAGDGARTDMHVEIRGG
ncbi:MAG: xanthine dehydrogenase family protein molybdopterin-binding subunit [Armatimonadota bacterium]|nr:xanthine dehydrogenase family protein molybdopterin-binding subunit [Armatimonadota bacterium]MDR7453631.1 xanthine dehydrogenase family protein molybdopterin-binding subunit [Armatimonadota bacterium]MDR7457605.1 xanthine dehydrogenase family protein molybdopterin-binding subunit [Armatimonadota bacterium]MDR7495484.1 xanthine dehydrogenase family protein molybdopterin-binding subunit [Armatimonadota bacterium]MDR7510425.1 xanthine dehydrogenase family protein molybdopterin-binding subunit 